MSDVDEAPDVDAPVSEEDDSSGQSDEDRYVIGAIGSLMEELRAKPARLVTDLPLYIPLVRHLKLPPLRRRFLEPVLISEVTGAIPFGEHEVDIKWHAVKDGKSATALAIAVQKEVVDSHVRRMKEAGKGPAATYSQAAALGLAAGVSDAMIVHLASDRESVVLVRDGVPQVVLQVWSPEETSPSEDRAEAMARAVEQMEGYDQTLGASAGDERLPLVLTGEVTGDDQLADELRQMLQREVLPLAPPLDLPEGFPVAEYATTVGLGLLDRSRPRPWRKATSDNLAALNLLSERHLPTPLPVRAIAVFALMAIFAVAAVLLTPTVNARENERDVKSVVLDKVETEERDHRLEAGAVASLERKAREKRQLTLDLSLKLDGLQVDIDELGEWFNKIETITQKSRPPNVSVSNLAPKEDQFTLSGRAQTFADAVRYATNICNSGLFVDVSLQQVGSAGAPLVFGQTELGLLEAVCDSAEASTTAPLLLSEGADEVGGAGLDFVIEATTRPPPGEETDDESEEGQGE